MQDEAKTAKALQIKMLADDQAETLYIVTGALEVEHPWLAAGKPAEYLL